MSNAQHLASSGSWYTPPEWIETVKKALGGFIDLDPCSSAKANEIVGARGFWDQYDNPLGDWTNWAAYSTTFFCNPPGSCPRTVGEEQLPFSVCGNKARCSCKLPQRFLQKCVLETDENFHGIYLAYSVNQIRQIGNLCIPNNILLSTAYPKDRIPYLDPATMQPKRDTNCDSAFLAMSTYESDMERFADTFADKDCKVYRMVR